MARTYPDVDAVSAAAANLDPADARKVSAVEQADGTYIVTSNDVDVLAKLDAGPSKDRLIAYTNAEQWRRATGGYTATIGGQSVVVPTDPTSMGLMTGKAARLGQPNPPSTINWQMPSGFVSIPAADFLPLASAVADFVQATFDALSVVLAAIDAGTVTTFAEIDAAAWPA